MFERQSADLSLRDVKYRFPSTLPIDHFYTSNDYALKYGISTSTFLRRLRRDVFFKLLQSHVVTLVDIDRLVLLNVNLGQKTNGRSEWTRGNLTTILAEIVGTNQWRMQMARAFFTYRVHFHISYDHRCQRRVLDHCVRTRLMVICNAWI